MKKGFTLIELLAAITVLAIISVVSIPKIIEVIYDSRVKAAYTSSMGLLEAGNVYFSNMQLEKIKLEDDIVIDFTDRDTIPDKFDFTGKYPVRGKMIITTTGLVYIDGYIEYHDIICTMKDGSYTDVDCGKGGLGTELVLNLDANTGLYYLDGQTTQTPATGLNKLKYDSWSTPRSNSTFWKDLTNTSYYKAVPIEDGWVKVEWDRRSDTNTATRYVNIYPKKGMIDYKPSTKYTLIVELRNVDISTADTGAFNIAKTASTDKSFTSAFSISAAQLRSGTTIFKKVLTTSTQADIDADTFTLRTFKTIPANTYGTFEARLMVLEGDYSTQNVAYQLYGTRPTPDYPAQLINKYKKGLYYSNVGGKVYMYYLDEDLKSLPNGVKDRLVIDPEDGNIYVEKSVGELIFDNTVTGLGGPAQYNRYNYSITDGYKAVYTVTDDLLCSHFKYNSSVWSDGADNVGIFYGFTTSNPRTVLYFRFGSGSTLTSQALLKQWFQEQKTAGTPFTVYYKLADTTLKELERK